MKHYQIQFVNVEGDIEGKKDFVSINEALIHFNKLLLDKEYNKKLELENIYYQLVEKENGKEDNLITSNLVKPYLD